MARVGHDCACAAVIDRHGARGADKVITDAIDAHVRQGQIRLIWPVLCACFGQGSHEGAHTGESGVKCEAVRQSGKSGKPVPEAREVWPVAALLCPTR